MRSATTPVPRWLVGMTAAAVGAVVIVTLAGVMWVASGRTDPPVAGPVTWSDDRLAWAGESPVSLAARSSAWRAAPAESWLPPEAFTLTVRARFSADSDPGAGWGVWLETEGGDRVLYALSGEGYTTTRTCPGADPPAWELLDCPALRPDWRWMPYPRILPPGRTNAITLHREPSGDIRLRINQEQLGAAPLALTGAWGLWWRGGRQDPAQITWERAERRTAR